MSTTISGSLRVFLLAFAVAVLAAFTTANLRAAPAPAGRDGSAPSGRQAEFEAAAAAAKAALQRGPAEIKFRDQAVLKLPEGYGFIPAQPAARFLRSMGNVIGDNILGMIISTGNGGGWFVVARFEPAGYIKDDDAKEWNAGDLLQNLKGGTEEANKERKSRGIPEIEVLGWVEAPHYDATAHQLVWSASSQAKGAAASEPKGINYNTYALGRDGYISMNLVTDLQSIESQKPVARALLAGLEFNGGKRYADFNASTDKVAAYGLAALVGGIAAKKLGLLAVIAAFVAKFAKVIGISALAAGGGLFKWWKGRKAKNPQA